jgi:Cdc6-like AAA superfamily ATPase
MIIIIPLLSPHNNQYNEGPIDLTTSSSTLQQSCLHISLTPPLPHKSITPWNTSSIIIHPYTLIDTPPEPEEIDGGDEEPITVCETLQLPHISLHTSWENLILAKHLKRDLLNYARSALLFSKKNVSPHIINWNRVLLLYGPPGTGKTSLVSYFIPMKYLVNGILHSTSWR